MRDRGTCLSRRRFLKGSLLLAAAPGLVLPAVRARAAEGPVAPSVLSLAEGPDPYGVTVRAVELLGGMKTFVREGARVLLKPNIGWDRRVEQGANTHPEVVRALAHMCLESGAEKVLILDRTCN
ncbi:MAG: DUF362 domain-containing protein, partial [bacterium]